jgi:hypothetical protein
LHYEVIPPPIEGWPSSKEVTVTRADLADRMVSSLTNDEPCHEQPIFG